MQTLEQSDRRPAGSAMSQREPLFKDAVLDCTAAVANVAQFVSFGPDLEQRFSRISEFRPNHVFPSIERAVAVILDGTPEKSVNVRSFDPLEPESREFAYGLKEVKLAVDKVRQLAQKGLYTIVNETVDVNDGGVSGVVLGDVVEFAPKDTPRCVEQPGVASLPRELGLRMLTTVYGFTPDLDYAPSQRVEFSLHPTRRGVRHGHTIVWQVEDVGEYAT